MKRQFLPKQIRKVKHDVLQLAKKKTLEYFKIQESLRLKVVQSIICVKEYFFVFFSTLKHILQVQNKINH